MSPAVTVNRKRLIQVRCAALILCCAFLVGHFIYFHAQVSTTPNYVGFEAEMTYLFDSLGAFRGIPYHYVDHPGVPVALLGSLLLGITSPIASASSEGFFGYHIQTPGLFLLSAHTLLTLVSLCCFVLLAVRVLPLEHWSDVLASLALPAAFFAFHPRSFLTLIYWLHTFFAFPFGTLILTALLLRLRAARRLTWQSVSAMGIAAGTLTAVVVLFAPWVVGIAVAVGVFEHLKGQHWRRAILAVLNVLASALVTFAFWLLFSANPAKFFDWLIRLVFHQGVYGGGETGIISANQAAENLTYLAAELPELWAAAGLIALGVLAVMIWKRRERRQNPGAWAAACGLLAQLALTALIIVKHPGINYVLAVAAALPPLLAVLFILAGSSSPQLKLLRAGIAAVVLAGFIRNGIGAIGYDRAFAASLSTLNETVENVLRDYASAAGRDEDSLQLLTSFGMYSRCNWLWYSNNFTGRHFTEEVASLCPRLREIDLVTGQIVLPDGTRQDIHTYAWDILFSTRSIVEEYPRLAEYGEPVIYPAQVPVPFKNLWDDLILIYNRER